MTSRHADQVGDDAHARFTALVHEHQRGLFAHVRVAGSDPIGGAPLVATVGGRSFHRDQLVLARWSAVDDGAQTLPSTSAVVTAQSSPAYIASISAA